MILTEYNEEEVMNGFKEEGRIEGKNEGIVEGKMQTLKSLVMEKILSISEAAKCANLSEADFVKYLEQTHTA